MAIIKIKKIEIWSSFPSPVGGVSIHAFRLLNALSIDGNVLGINFSQEELMYSSKLIRKSQGIFEEILRLMFIDRRHYIHLHTLQLTPLLVLTLLFRKRVLITLHNKNLLGFTSFKKRVYLFIFKLANVVFINESTLYNYLKVRDVNVIQTPAFLPPSLLENESLPSQFLKFREAKKYLVSMSVWTFNPESFQVYGLKYVLPILNKFPDIGMCICISGKIEPNFYETFKSDLKREGKHSDVLILENEISNGSIVWRESDIFLRPTSTDAEGISVKEALYYNTPVIASDVCDRPLGTEVFKAGDLDDLLSKIGGLLINLEEKKNHLYAMDKSKIASSKIYIEKVYKKLLEQ